MNLCNGCSKQFERKSWQEKKQESRCPACRSVYLKLWRARRKAQGRPVISSPKTAEYRAAYDAIYQRLPAVRKRRATNVRRYAKDPRKRHKYLARWEAKRAISRGLIVRKPCEVCGESKVHAHHDDYSKPLNIRWLCLIHHRQFHAAAKEHSE